MIPDKNFMRSDDTARPLSSRLASVLASLLLLASLAPASFAQGNPHARTLGDSKIFTTLPAQPGFPESLAVSGGRLYVSGGAQFGYFVPPAVLAYDIETGQQVASYPLQGENPSFPMAGTGLAFGKNDMLYVGSLQQGVLRFDVDNPGGPMQHYASALPDLPTCASVSPARPARPRPLTARRSSTTSSSTRTATSTSPTHSRRPSGACLQAAARRRSGSSRPCSTPRSARTA